MRALFALLLAVWSNFQVTLTACVEGCLKCAVGTDACLYCDNRSGFILSEGKCIKKSVQSCALLSLDGACAECLPGYYPLSGLCAQASPPIENCAVMTSETVCRYCASGYYFSGGKCVAVENPIDNCLFHEDEGVCGRCVPQSFLFIDQRYCFPIADPANCLSFSQIQCSKCRSGFFMNKNLFFKDVFSNFTNSSSVSSFLDVYKNRQMRFQTSVCQKGNINFCEQFDGSNNCAVCASGFSLLNGNCYNVTLPLTSSCAVQNEDGRCLECLPSFFLNGTSCAPVVPIQNCQRYNSRAAFVQCLECLPDYFLLLGNCVKRVLSLQMPNCTALAVSDDSCALCATASMLTDDKLACLPALPLCREYFPSSRSSSALQCRYCQNGLFFNAKSGQCLNGTVSNCLDFEQFSDECVICKEGFYRSALGDCLPHMFFGVRVCANFSQSVPHSCDFCPQNYVRLPNANSCNPIKNPIAGCFSYRTQTSCEICVAGQVPSANRATCVAQTVPNCMRESAPGVCEECASYLDSAFGLNTTYRLSADKHTCSSQDLTKFKNCRKLKDDSPSLECAGCKQNYYPSFLSYRFSRCLATSNYKLADPSVAAKLPGCEVFDLDVAQCVKCSAPKVLSAGACVASCAAGEALYRQEVLKDYINDSFYVNRRNYCGPAPFANCVRAETSVNARGLNFGGAVLQGCVECAAGYSALVDLGFADSGLGHLYSANPGRSSLSNRFTFVHDCVATATVLANLLTVGSSLTNCRYIQKIGVKYGCLSCNFGFTGVVVATGTGYFIESCAAMADCDASSWFSGFGGLQGQLKALGPPKFPLELYLSCHQCADPAKAVFFETNIGVARASTTVALLGGLSVWGLDANPPYSTAAPIAQNICAVPNPAWSLPANCAVIMVLSDLPLNGYSSGQPTSSSGVVCVACKPGFKASANASGFVLSCTAIQNCLVPEFNGCRQCAANFAFGFDQVRGAVDFGFCLSNAKSPNCLFGYLNSDDNFVCAVCQEGFVLNHDLLCDPIEIDNCSAASVFLSLTTTPPSSATREPLDLLVWFEPNNCKACGFGQLFVEGTSLPFCAKNAFLSAYGFPSSGYFARNCLENYYDGATDSVRCAECSSANFNINGRCYPPADPAKVALLGKCVVFDPYTQKCAKCDDFYFLDAGVCYQGFLPFCAEYESWDKCVRCQDGFVLVPTKNETTVCLAASAGLSCSLFSTNSSLEGVLECAQCQSGFYAATAVEETPAFSCLEVTAVKNCARHNITFNLRYSGFECLECQPDFYLKFNFCFNRTKITNCDAYSLTDDKCALCAKTFQLSGDGFECAATNAILMPVENCRRLFDLENCAACAENYYLADNRCLEVPSEFRVQFCLYYTPLKKCESCIPGFFNKDNQCVLANATGCLEFETVDRCLSCPGGYGFELKGELMNCVKAEIANCVDFDEKKPAPFECLVCAPGFYLVEANKTCAPVEMNIEFCVVFRDSSTCLKCDKDMAIAPDGKYCYASPDILDYVDQNCEESFLSNDPMCNICAFGFHFSDDKCTACRNNILMTGCMYCDAENEDVCLMCNLGFFMNNDGKCIAIKVLDIGSWEGIGSRFLKLSLLMAVISL